MGLLAHLSQAINMRRELIEVNDNYLDFVNDLAIKKNMHQSKLKPKGYKDNSFVGSEALNMGTLELESKVGLDLKDEVQLRVNLES
jgi:hypothetical protein